MSKFSLPDLSTYLESLHSSLPTPLQTYFTRTNIQLLLRVVVVISTFILFQPHLKSLFHKTTGTPDQRQEEIQARLEFLRQQREGTGGQWQGEGGSKGKSVGVVGKGGGVYKVVAPTQDGKVGEEKAVGRKRKRKGRGRAGGGSREHLCEGKESKGMV